MKNIHVIGAMREELSQLIGRKKITGTTVHQSGVGKVNATMTTMLALEYNPRAVVVIGTAGALDPSLDIGDIVIGHEAQQHDVDVTPLGFARGNIPFERVSCWQADARLVRAAEAACASLSLRTVKGKVLSGDRFVADREEARWLHNELGGSCIEMEGAAVAQVCGKFNMPWLIIRMISDTADTQADSDFPKALELAATRCAQIMGLLPQKLHAQVETSGLRLVT